MCIYTRFRYLCLHEKLKIVHTCNKASLDPHGILACPDDPKPQVDDGKQRTYAARTYGVGVCASIHCAWYHSILPLGDYGNNKRFGNSTSFEDDTEIVDSPEAREDHVARWYRLLNADQQLDHYHTEYPLPLNERSAAGRALLEFPYGAAVAPLETLKWQELNPLHLDPAMLQWCVFSRVLPASIADGRKSNTISPHQPLVGPFKLARSHKCSKKHGICKTCGENIGDPALKEATLAHRQKTAMTALTKEDRAKEDPRGTVLDPSVDLKWDDEKSRYLKVPADNNELQSHDAPYPTSSTPTFVPSVTQPVDTAAISRDQDVDRADVGAEIDMEGMDWDSFAASASLEDLSPTAFGAPYWPDPNFPSTAEVPSLSDPKYGPFSFDPAVSFDPSFSFDADFDAAAAADMHADAYEQIDFALPGSNVGSLFGDTDGDVSMNMNDQTAALSELPFRGFPNDQFHLDSSITSNQPTSQPTLDPSLQAPHIETSTSTSTCPTLAANDSTIPIKHQPNSSTNNPNPSFEYLVSNFITKQQIANNETQHQPPPETMRLLAQMLRQASAGGVVRPSYDREANGLFETMLQHALAGLL